LPFCKFALEHEAFVSGNIDTHFVGKYFTPDVLKKENLDTEEIAAMFVAKLYEESNASQTSNTTTKVASKWKTNRLK
jgi:acetyl-CoA carboxylase, biotin carboxylase subunit